MERWKEDGEGGRGVSRMEDCLVIFHGRVFLRVQMKGSKLLGV